MSTKVSAADSSSGSNSSHSSGHNNNNHTAGNTVNVAATIPSSNSNGVTPPRRLRTRTSTNGNELSQKKNLSHSFTDKVHYASGDSNSNGNTNSVSSTCDDKLTSSKRYHSSCPQLSLTGRKDRNHSQPHSSSSFDMNKTEEFHFDTPHECPVFRPTLEEFKNPLAYISKIRPIAEKCGIAKILPPESWSPPFAVDVDKLKFTPRVQRLNELEAKTRVKLNFLDQIAKFWELQGSSLKIPMVERKALDLYSLHRIVQEEGGMEQTTKDRKWAKVANRMSYPTSKSVGATLKAHYERILHPFEVYTSGKVLGSSSVTANAEVKLEDGTDYKTHEIPTRQQIAPPNENSARRSKRFANSNISCGLGANKSIKIESKEDFKRDLLNSFTASTSTSNSRSGSIQTAVTSSSSAKKVTDNAVMIDPLMKYICHICNRGDVEESMLLCDGCDDSYHTFCLLPPLSSIPKG